ncbi:MAG: bifunctional [glutamate--ammonia ligase]-adenylyl-L-tyrosine phosphorylase/[glutamate--ammonia-ligase] adenylyltransferase, partial [Planctomycetales bacterium]|nr:bifunctional [glutamate--ammonia ligase]-adenylyl-L-tyrosine phosphorylase/[glutamate--ammonia-ligase] adenylyltransferase [Planctomycetales bacterium]
MDIERLVSLLDNPADARSWLETLGVDNAERGQRNLEHLSQCGMTLDLLAVIVGQLAKHLPSMSDPGMALNSFERFVAQTRSPLAFGSLLERDPESLAILLQIMSSSQYLADLLIRDPDVFDLLRITEGQPVARQVLVDEIRAEVERANDERMAMSVLRRYKQRETLRIAYGDIVRGQSIDTVTQQISYLADALCEGAIRFARRQLESKRGAPRRPDGATARFVALALGKLGGEELNYSSDIDLIFLSDDDGATDGERSISNREFFDRLAANVVKLLSETTDLGIAYRVDLRLRPDGKQGPPVHGISAALQYYDVSGRTWERQAFVKARAIAGDVDLGQAFLERLEPWVFRRYLTRADIAGIKALKRRIERRAKLEQGDTRNVKTGRGGIRDIEFVIQFLQLLNGGDLRQLRTSNTLAAIAALEQVGCLTFQERSILERNYAFLRKIEHRLQIMFDLQTHTLPEGDVELRRVAIRMGYADTHHAAALADFQRDLRERTVENRKILDHLLHDAFGDEERTEPEVDLILDPEPSAEIVAQHLGKYGFNDIAGAYRNLMALSEERVAFLSTRRCRHFLASISPALLQAIAATPDPDSTLVNLCAVSDSLGGKGVLWELFSFNPPSLQLYVRLCATSPYLAGILTSNPGMIDELMDSLLLDKLPTHESLLATLKDLLRGAEDAEPILHSFKNSLHLRVGVRDVLGKEDVRDTHRALSDIAEVCLAEIADREALRLMERYGQPTVGDEQRPCELIILAMGKLGGREPNYHSDLDVIFLYEADGMTRPNGRGRKNESTTNQHFFSQLGQRIIKEVTRLGPYGRLYEMDPRLRPTGKSGSLACSVAEFSRYFQEGAGQLWERQALCKARPVYGSAAARDAVNAAVRDAVTCVEWQPAFADDIRVMRRRLEETASARNLKRGPGGTVDIEFLVQMLQLRCAGEFPEVLVPGTLDAI